MFDPTASLPNRRSRDRAAGSVSTEPEALSRALDRARTLTATWRGRGLPRDTRADVATGSSEGTRWLLHVPDIGPSCEVLLADRLLHDLTPAERDGLLAFVRATQDESGAWLDALGRPDLSLTALGWWACRAAGDDPASEPMMRASRVVHALGGAQRAHFSVRLWLAMGGQIPWSWLPAIPSELFLLPGSTPLSPMRFSPWARGMLMPYQVIARAPARLQLPDAGDLLLQRADGSTVAPRLTRPGLAGDLLQAFDRTVKLSRKFPRGPVPRLAATRVSAWIDAAQQEHGGWFSARPTLLSLVALRVSGRRSGDAQIRRGLEYLRRARGHVRLPDGRVGLAQGLGGSSLAVAAQLLAAAPTDADLAWLLRQELQGQGPWQARADASAGGWPSEPGAGHHLDVEATCAVLDAIGTLPETSSQATAAWATARRAVDVLLAMQEPDGHVSRFERGESDVFMQRLPWSDADLLAFGQGDDDVHVRLTAHALSCLGGTGFGADDDRVSRGIQWLSRTIADARHVAMHARPLATVTSVARCAGTLLPASHPLSATTEQALRTRQREDGSFGTPVDTARALSALVAMGHTCVQARRAARNLVEVLAAPETSPDTWGALANRGFGLDPMGRDPSAGPREAAMALQAFADRGGTLSTSPAASRSQPRGTKRPAPANARARSNQR